MNAYLTDKNLSLSAKGFLSYILLLAEESGHFDIGLEEAFKNINFKDEALLSLSELVTTGYVRIEDSYTTEGDDAVFILIDKTKVYGTQK